MFFQPIFNIADSAISIGVFIAILFYRRFQRELEPATVTQTNPSSKTITNTDPSPIPPLEDVTENPKTGTDFPLQEKNKEQE